MKTRHDEPSLRSAQVDRLPAPIVCTRKMKRLCRGLSKLEARLRSTDVDRDCAGASSAREGIVECRNLLGLLCDATCVARDSGRLDHDCEFTDIEPVEHDQIALTHDRARRQRERAVIGGIRGAGT